MPSDRKRVCGRLKLVEKRLANPDREFEYKGQGRGRRRMRPADRRDMVHHREARLLRKLLARADEGQVLAMLETWRRELGRFLTKLRGSSMTGSSLCWMT